jgi:hypothetical protein
MKMIFLSKAVRTIGLMAVLSTIVGTTVQQTVQAQTQNETQTQVELSAEPTAANYDTDYSGYPPEFYDEEGNFFFYEFVGIEFTPEQEAAYNQAKQTLSERGALMKGEIVSEPLPGGGLSFGPRENVILPPALEEEILAASSEYDRMGMSEAEKQAALTEKYGQYIEFSSPVRLRFTPEQILEKIMTDREFEDAMLSVFTPDQQRIYIRNLGIKYRITGSDTDLSDG